MQSREQWLALAQYNRMNAILDLAIERARTSLSGEQREDGHFIYELEADATISRH